MIAPATRAAHSVYALFERPAAGQTIDVELPHGGRICGWNLFLNTGSATIALSRKTPGGAVAIAHGLCKSASESPHSEDLC